MKIVRIKTGRPEKKKDMFAVLCLIQSVALILTVLLIFAVSRADSDLFESMKQDIGKLFADDYDIGGYYTGEENITVHSSVITLSSVNEVAKKIDSGKNDSVTFSVCKADTGILEACDDAAVMPVNGTVTSEYGNRIHPIYNTESFHSGRDIAAAEGSNIYAVRDGHVIEAGRAANAGIYAKIDHGNGYVALYCHCSELYVEEGINVRKGDVIAAVGQTGLATGPHLHFELRKDGVITDPEEILAGAVNVD